MKKSLFALMMVLTFSFMSLPSTLFQVESVYAQEEVSAAEPVEISVAAPEAQVEQPAPEVKKELPQIPEGDPLATLWKLVTDWKTASPVALGILFVMFIAQLSKAGWIESIFAMLKWENALEWKRAIITLTSIVYGFLFYLQNGSAWSASLLAVISAVGAVGIYEGFKGLYYLISGKKKAKLALVKA